MAATTNIRLTPPQRSALWLFMNRVQALPLTEHRRADTPGMGRGMLRKLSGKGFVRAVDERTNPVIRPTQQAFDWWARNA